MTTGLLIAIISCLVLILITMIMIYNNIKALLECSELCVARDLSDKDLKETYNTINGLTRKSRKHAFKTEIDKRNIGCYIDT